VSAIGFNRYAASCSVEDGVGFSQRDLSNKVYPRPDHLHQAQVLAGRAKSDHVSYFVQDHTYQLAGGFQLSEIGLVKLHHNHRGQERTRPHSRRPHLTLNSGHAVDVRGAGIDQHAVDNDLRPAIRHLFEDGSLSGAQVIVGKPHFNLARAGYRRRIGVGLGQFDANVVVARAAVRKRDRRNELHTRSDLQRHSAVQRAAAVVVLCDQLARTVVDSQVCIDRAVRTGQSNLLRVRFGQVHLKDVVGDHGIQYIGSDADPICAELNDDTVRSRLVDVVIGVARTRIASHDLANVKSDNVQRAYLQRGVVERPFRHEGSRRGCAVLM